MNLKNNFADKSNYGGARKASAIKYIVVHYTANDGDTDEANARYFKTKGRGASAHYFVDDDSVTCSVPDLYTAWSVGGSRYSNYKSTGGASLYKVCTNANSINVEMCDTRKDGVLNVSEKTLANTVELIQVLMSKYNIPLSNVIRHFDVTGKACPAYYASRNNKMWNGFLNRIKVGSCMYNGVDYSAVFNADIYASTYIDLKNAYGDDKVKLFDHFCKCGMSEGRQAHAFFNVHNYRKRYPDLDKAFGDNLPMYYYHYCVSGKNEGRTGI